MSAVVATSWYSLVASLVQVVLVGVGGPLLMGLMAKVRARAEGRVGAPVVQPLRDLRKLLARERLRPRHTSLVREVSPLVVLAATLVVVVMAPLVSTHPLLRGGADLFVVVYLLLTSSIAVALGGLDTGTAFGGMGASRAMTIGALAEPALMVAVVALAIQSRTSNLVGIVAASLAHPAWALTPTRLLAVVALVIVVIAEAGRLPVDNPSTHLELTMVHEAMVLEYAGADLALVQWGAATRLALLFSLLVNLFVPFGVAQGPSLVGLVVAAAILSLKAMVLAVAVSLIEVHSAKLRLFRVPELLAGSFVFSILAVISGLVTR